MILDTRWNEQENETKGITRDQGKYQNQALAKDCKYLRLQTCVTFRNLNANSFAYFSITLIARSISKHKCKTKFVARKHFDFWKRKPSAVLKRMLKCLGVSCASRIVLNIFVNWKMIKYSVSLELPGGKFGAQVRWNKPSVCENINQNECFIFERNSELAKRLEGLFHLTCLRISCLLSKGGGFLGPNKDLWH